MKTIKRHFVLLDTRQSKQREVTGRALSTHGSLKLALAAGHRVGLASTPCSPLPWRVVVIDTHSVRKSEIVYEFEINKTRTKAADAGDAVAAAQKGPPKELSIHIDADGWTFTTPDGVKWRSKMLSRGQSKVDTKDDDVFAHLVDDALTSAVDDMAFRLFDVARAFIDLKVKGES